MDVLRNNKQASLREIQQFSISEKMDTRNRLQQLGGGNSFFTDLPIYLHNPNNDTFSKQFIPNSDKNGFINGEETEIPTNYLNNIVNEGLGINKYDTLADMPTITRTQPDNTTTTEPASSKSGDSKGKDDKKPWYKNIMSWILILIICILVGVGIYFIILSNKKGKSKRNKNIRRKYRR